MKMLNCTARGLLCCIWGVVGLCSLGEQAAGLPADPDNAALLYYQASLSRPEPNEATSWLIDEVIRGAQPNEQVRKYLNQQSCQETIERALAATHIPMCDWGIRYSLGHDIPGVISCSRQLCFLLEVSARTLAADGKYRAALDRCLAVRRLAAHLGTATPFTSGTSPGLERRSLICIQHVLGSMPPDTDTLAWMKDQLTAVPGVPRSPERDVNSAADFILQSYRSHPELMSRWRKGLAVDEGVNKEILSLTPIFDTMRLHCFLCTGLAY